MIAYIILLANFLVYATCAPFVQIPQGALIGRSLKTLNGRTFSSFTGIPYAEPPVKSLRFELPEPAKPWNGTLEATKLIQPMCPQVNTFIGAAKTQGNEDCLYLNVYTPQVTFSNITKVLPVMFYIHGGAFHTGSANQLQYNPSTILDKDVLLVVPNFRIGALGFFSTGDDVIPGNNGLKDQNLALKWVRQNIKYFGGDPEKITVWGQSSGGACAHLHMLSPLSRDLIKGVISQSGTAINNWKLSPNRENEVNAKKLASALNCTTDSSKEMIQCLKQASAAEITEKQHSFYQWEADPMVPFKPVVEPDSANAFLSANPIEIIKSGNAAKVPFLTGVTTEEGALRSPQFFKKPHLLQELNEDFERIAPIIFLYDGIESDKELVTRRIKEFYFNNATITNSSEPELTNAFTDTSFLSGATNAVWLHINHTDQPVYFYAFGYRGSFSFASLFDKSYDYGVSHTDDLLYLFTFEGALPGYKPTQADKNLTNIMITLWTNFATFGNPTPTSQPELVEEWKPVKSTNLEYYFIKSQPYMDDKLFWNRTQFWKSLPFYQSTL